MNNPNILNVYKPIGKTPLGVIKQLKALYPEKYEAEKMSYAGRLDPLAHGVLILLVGEENKKRRTHEKTDKDYSFRAIFGIETDTYDVLGFPKVIDIEKKITEKDINKELENFKGTVQQQIPAFSSYIINKKPLHYWARTNQLEGIEIPKRDVKISHIELVELKKVKVEDIATEIIEQVKSVEGIFRQDEIVPKWEKVLEDNKDKELYIAEFKSSVTTGTYVRSIVHDLGKNLGVGGSAMNIYRTRVDEYIIEESLRL